MAVDGAGGGGRLPLIKTLDGQVLSCREAGWALDATTAAQDDLRVLKWKHQENKRRLALLRVLTGEVVKRVDELMAFMQNDGENLAVSSSPL